MNAITILLDWVGLNMRRSWHWAKGTTPRIRKQQLKTPLRRPFIDCSALPSGMAPPGEPARDWRKQDMGVDGTDGVWKDGTAKRSIASEIN